MGSKQQKCFDLFIQNDKKGQTNMKNQHITMPALALRGLVIFPGMILHFDIARDRSINAVEEAIEHNDRRIFLVTQIDEDVDEVAAENLYKTGVVAEIRQTLNTPDVCLCRVFIRRSCAAHLRMTRFLFRTSLLCLRSAIH